MTSHPLPLSTSESSLSSLIPESLSSLELNLESNIEPNTETNIEIDGLLWRKKAQQALNIWQDTLYSNGLLTPSMTDTIKSMLQKITTNRYTVAIVSEVSRGKSELINALLFSQYGQRVVPAGTGRTTLCPTEFFCDFNAEPYLELLPMDTRMTDDKQLDCNKSLRELLNTPSAWQRYPLEVINADTLALAIQKTNDLQQLSFVQAQSLGFFTAVNINKTANNTTNGVTNNVTDSAISNNLLDDNQVFEVPLWRYARINLHHSLLATGLSLLDTPGINALGYEIALTNEVLSNIDGAIFILDATTGITQLEQWFWDTYLSHLPSPNKYLILNKIDTLSDVLRSQDEVDDIIAKQIKRNADLLNINQSSIFAISAQQGLVARVTNNIDVFESSCLGYLEANLGTTLLQKCELYMQQQVLQVLTINYHFLSKYLATDICDINKYLNRLKTLRDSKDRVYALHAYISDTKRREHMEQSIVARLRQKMVIHSQIIINKVLPNDIENNFFVVIDSCKTENISNIQQHLSLALAAAQLRLIDLKNEFQTIKNMVIYALLKLQKLHAEPAGLNVNVNDLIDLPAMSSIDVALLEMKHLIKQHKPSAIYLFSHLKLLHLTQVQRHQKIEKIHQIMEKNIRLCNQVYTDFLSWFEILLQYIQQAQVEHQSKLTQRYDALQRMQIAQDDLTFFCQSIQNDLQAMIVKKHQLDTAYTQAHTALKIADTSETLT
ncbi:MAG: hypothetical protein RI956_374 [Pseudomonadota bacterium]|jgi:GTPase SAR1 family protein